VRLALWSGCIRLGNEEVGDLSSRIDVGTKVIVLPMDRRADNVGRASEADELCNPGVARRRDPLALPTRMFLDGNKFGGRSHTCENPRGSLDLIRNMAKWRRFLHSGALFPCPVDSP
jgi:hypothetical protein